MSQMTAIEWTDETWNPVTGCSKVSPGCAHCYAEAITELRAGQRGWIAEHRPWTPVNAAHNVQLRPERLDQPLRWRRPRMVFVNSMSDLFHEQVPDDYIARVFAVMADSPRHTFQILTKRPERAKKLLGGAYIQNEMDEWTQTGIFSRSSWPLPNVWLGVSIENRRFIHRADSLRETPAAVRFISAEPLLGPLIARSEDGMRYWDDWWDGPELDLTAIDWLIVGGESGRGHRPIKEQWVTDLRDAAAQHGAAFFFKQWGGLTPKAGGRELDGRTWDEMPPSALAVDQIKEVV